MGTLPTRGGLVHVSQVGRPAQGRPWMETSPAKQPKACAFFEVRWSTSSLLRGHPNPEGLRVFNRLGPPDLFQRAGPPASRGATR